MQQVNIPLKITYDPETDSAYLYFSNEQSAQSVDVDLPDSVRGSIVLDVDKFGHMSGIEILNTSAIIPNLTKIFYNN